jgi:hypothetical protein
VKRRRRKKKRLVEALGIALGVALLFPFFGSWASVGAIRGLQRRGSYTLTLSYPIISYRILSYPILYPYHTIPVLYRVLYSLAACCPVSFFAVESAEHYISHPTPSSFPASLCVV